MECALSAALQSEVPRRSPGQCGRILISPPPLQALLLEHRVVTVSVCVCVYLCIPYCFLLRYGTIFFGA